MPIRPRAFLILFVVVLSTVSGLVLFASRPAGPMDTLDGCSIDGDSTSPRKMEDNRRKNRYDFPKTADVRAIDFPELLQAKGPNDLHEGDAVTITGYVRKVKEGGVESCNCKAKDPFHRDTHLELTPDPDSPDNMLIVTEVTPRVRIIVGKKGLDWSTNALRELKGKKVKITGWLYFDPDHVEEAFAEDPEDQMGRKNWRGTSWEVHPVTGIEVIDR